MDTAEGIRKLVGATFALGIWIGRNIAQCEHDPSLAMSAGTLTYLAEKITREETNRANDAELDARDLREELVFLVNAVNADRSGEADESKLDDAVDSALLAISRTRRYAAQEKPQAAPVPVDAFAAAHMDHDERRGGCCEPDAEAVTA